MVVVCIIIPFPCSKCCSTELQLKARGHIYKYLMCLPHTQSVRMSHRFSLQCFEHSNMIERKCVGQCSILPLDSSTYWLVSGFHTGGAGIPPPPQKILKLSNVLSQVLNNNLVPDCVRSNVRGSKFKIFLGKRSMPPDPLSRHTRLHVRERAFTHRYHHVFPPPTQNPVWNPECTYWNTTLVQKQAWEDVRLHKPLAESVYFHCTLTLELVSYLLGIK